MGVYKVMIAFMESLSGELMALDLHGVAEYMQTLKLKTTAQGFRKVLWQAVAVDIQRKTIERCFDDYFRTEAENMMAHTEKQPDVHPALQEMFRKSAESTAFYREQHALDLQHFSAKLRTVDQQVTQY